MCRSLTDRERFVFQGHASSACDMFPSQRANHMATGNAYPVPMLAVQLIPMIKQAVQSKVITRAKRQSDVPLNTLMEMASVFDGIPKQDGCKRRRRAVLSKHSSV